MRNRILWEIIFILGISIIVSSCSSSSSTSSTSANIIGLDQPKENLTLIFCYDPNDPNKAYEPIKSLPITITNISDPSICYPINSDSEGRCDFTEITPGEYQLVINDETWIRVSTCYIDHNGNKSTVATPTFTTTQFDDPKYGVYIKKK